MNTLPNIADMKDSRFRIDLKLGKAIDTGLISNAPVRYEMRRSWHNPLAFIIGNTHIWQTRNYWQIADLVDNLCINHRGFSPDLLISINSVLESKGYEPIDRNLFY